MMDAITEEWRDVPGQPGVRISSLGRVRGRRGWILCRKPGLNGYLYMRGVDRHPVSYHSMVLAAFVGPRPLGHVIDHIDRNPLNNAITNLRYCTQAENCANSPQGDRAPAVPRRPTYGAPRPLEMRQRGAQNANAKLTDEQVREILKLPRPSGRGRASTGPESLATIAARYGVGETTIHDIFSGKKWGHLKPLAPPGDVEASRQSGERT